MVIVMGEDNIKEAKFIATDEGEFGLVITKDREFKIIDVEKDTTVTLSTELVDEMFYFLQEYWE